MKCHWCEGSAVIWRDGLYLCAVCRMGEHGKNAMAEIFSIFTMRPDGSTWEYRGDIRATDRIKAGAEATPVLLRADGVKREMRVRGPKDTFPIKQGLNGPLVFSVLKQKMPKKKPKPVRRPIGRFRKEDYQRALEQDEETREFLSELFEPLAT